MDISECRLANGIYHTSPYDSFFGAVGEVIGWVYDAQGKLLDCDLNDRVASTPLFATNEKLVYGIAAGKDKLSAIHGALRSNIINCLVTNEFTATGLPRFCKTLLAVTSEHKSHLELSN